MPVGTASFDVRHSVNPETVPGTTDATPSWKTLHNPIKWEKTATRFHQRSQIAGGAHFGDALLTKDADGNMAGPIVYGVNDQLFETLLQSTWTADAMTDAKLEKTMSCEESFAKGVGGSLAYIRRRGVEAVGATLEADAGSEIKFSMDLAGRQVIDTDTAALAGATYTDPVNKDPLSAATDFGAITFAGFTLDELQSIKINFNYDKRAKQRKMGGTVLNGITRGAFIPSIEASFYVGTNLPAIYDAANANTQSSAKLTVNIGSVTLKKYRFEFWKCYVDWSQLDWGGENGFVKLMITPEYSPSNSGVLTMTRAIA